MDFHRKLQVNIFYRHFDLPANFPVIALLGSTWSSNAEPVTRMHFHNCLELGYLYEGQGQIYIEDKIVPVKAPCITITPPNVPHYSRANDGTLCHWNWLYVDPIRLLPHLNPRLADDLNQYQRTLSGEDCMLTFEDHPKIGALVRMIIDEIENTRTNYHEIVRELFYALFLMLLRVTRTSATEAHYANQRMSYIAPAISHIAENYMSDISIEELAHLCHVSASHFRRLFKQVLGWSPQEYLQIIRVDRACALLYNCDYSITDIGMQVGYPSPSSFCRQFKRIYGMSPSQWRQKIRSEENPVVTAYFNAVPPTSMQFFPMEYSSGNH